MVFLCAREWVNVLLTVIKKTIAADTDYFDMATAYYNGSMKCELCFNDCVTLILLEHHKKKMMWIDCYVNLL